ncbi:MAG TPA: glycosyltransferase [Candidatus Sulfomarinibacteraceae bacterium]|nr:glycosyltransferase [Candidatus Sulfomarinibacteraceae bacterium]
MSHEHKLRIVHVYKDYHPIIGGIENHIKTLAERQVEAGHDVTVLVTNPRRLPPVERVNGVRVIRAARLATLTSTPISPTLPFLLRRQRPDITHLHFPYPIGEISQLLVGRRRPYVITYHSDVVRQKQLLRLYEPLLWRILRGAARILPTSERYVTTSPYLTPLRRQCTVIPLSVDPLPFQNAQPLLQGADCPTLLFVGRHRYYKGLDDLLRAMVHLPARLLVAGDGPVRADWEAEADRLELGHKVRFLGTISDEDLPGLYASADIFVLPANSRTEAFGKVLLEAMAADLPCVTTEVGTGTSFVVEDGVSGYVVPPRDAASLATAIARLLEDDELRQKMGRAGRRRVLAEFTPELMEARVARVYREVIVQQNPGTP